nr:restriction endonuclease subunit S [uncultured Roseateles sp.]
MIQSSSIPLEEVIARKNGSVDPSKFPEEVFELLSIPAFDAGRPEVVRGRDIGSSKQVVQPGDVLLSKIVPHIRRAWVVRPTTSHRLIASGEWIVFRDERFLPDYLKHLLTSDGFHQQFMQTVSGVGGSLLRARPSEVAKIRVPVPSKAEQQRVATILDKAHSLRRKRQEAIRLADEFLRAVFIDMFGDPGSNPKNFETGTIRDLVASANYGTSEKASEEAGKYAILRMNNITYQGGWDFSSLKYVDLEPATAHKYLTQRGDLLFNRTNSKELVGKTAVYMRDEPMAIAGYLVRVRINEKGNPHYVSGYLNSAHGKQTLVSRAKSIVGMANINAQEMQDIPLLLPPKDLQDKFGRVVEEVTRRASKHHVFAQQADKLRAALANQFFCTETAYA